VGPQRRVASANDAASPNFNPIGEINLVAGGNYAAITQSEARVKWIDCVGLGYRIDLIHPNQFGISAQTDQVAATYDIQVPNPDMITHDECLHTNKNVQMTDG
jgi:hypothetical protein